MNHPPRLTLALLLALALLLPGSLPCAAETPKVEEVERELETVPIGGGDAQDFRTGETKLAPPPPGTILVTDPKLGPTAGGTVETAVSGGKTGEVAVDKPKSEFPKPGKVARADLPLNVRNAPWGEVIGSVRNGEDLEILAAAGSWYKIRYRGGEGYVHASYVDTDKAKADAFTGWVKGGTAVLSGPDGEKIGDLAKGFKIDEVLKRVGDYYEIKYKGRLGFVKADAITTDPVQPDPPKPPAGGNPVDAAKPPVSGNMDPRAPGVIAWAKAQLGRTDYNGWCQKFVHNAYGRSYGYASAKACYNDIGRKDSIGNLGNVPVGSLVFFDGHPQYGHVGIYIGDGKVIHGVATVRIEDMRTGWLGKSYLGWAPAPASWPGH